MAEREVRVAHVAYAVGARRAMMEKLSDVAGEMATRLVGGLGGALGGVPIGEMVARGLGQKHPSAMAAASEAFGLGEEGNVSPETLRAGRYTGALGGGALGALAPRLGAGLGGMALGGYAGQHLGRALGRQLVEESMWSDDDEKTVGGAGAIGKLLGAGAGFLGGAEGMEAAERYTR
jgi:hypothetical protein